MATADHARGNILVVDDEPTIGEVRRPLPRARRLRHARRRRRPRGDGGRRAAAPRTSSCSTSCCPASTGWRSCAASRERDRDHTAIILLTARGEESDRVVGLRLGADDYVVKPFSPAELVARVDAVLRRLDTSPGHRGADAVRRPRHRPDRAPRDRRRGEEVALTQREFELLQFLARHPGQAFTRNQLMDLVWRYSFYTDTSTVTVHIRRLRTKIEPDPARPRHIDTVWGVGYRFSP